MNSPSDGKTVPFFHYPHVFTSDRRKFLSIIADVGRRGAFVLQRDLEQFERNLARYLGAKYVVGTANATDALHLALGAAGIGPGDEVIFSSHTMVATPAAIHFCGAVPIPVECGPDHLIDPDAVEKAVTPRTRAVMPTQLNGRTADMNALQTIARKHKLLIVEDAAQALGSRYRGRAAGTFGIAGAISFYPAKTLGCFGDGGCVVTDDDALYRKLLLLRDHGRDARGDVVAWGWNSRLDNLHAAILDYKLRHYDRAVTRRRELAAMYHRLLSPLRQLRLPPPPDDDPDHFDIYQNYEIEAAHRDRLRAFLRQRGVGTLLPWGGKAVHQFRKLGFTERLPFTEKLFTRLLLLPMNTSLTDEDVEHVCRQVKEFYAARGRYAPPVRRNGESQPENRRRARKPKSTAPHERGNGDTRALARKIRLHAIRMSHRAHSSHVGSSLSMAELLAVLYRNVLHLSPETAGDADRDRLILSKGHGAAAFYAVLAECGFFPRKRLESFYHNGAGLSGHVTAHGVPGVEVSTGALGHGLSIGCGLALAGRRDRRPYRVFVLLSDGECDEGSVWEAALFAPHHRLDNLIAIVDYNKIQALGHVKDVLDLEPFAAKWTAFGWAVREIDGHDVDAVDRTLRRVPFDAGKPSCVIAHTVKGKGVSFMEDKLLWHYRTPQAEEFDAAIAELET